MIQVVWFKRDLRTADHRPLAAAAAAGPVLPLYVVEPEYWRLPDTSLRQWTALRSAVVELSRRLSILGAPLIVRTGAVTEVLAKIHAAVKIARILAHEETGNLWTFRRDLEVRAFCRRHGIALVEFSQTGVIRGSGARDRWAAHYARFLRMPTAAEPARLEPVPGARAGTIPTAGELGLREDACVEPQSGTRRHALELLDSFLGGRGADYRRGMSSPLGAAHCCSRLSVGLATGAVSVREVVQRLEAARGQAAVPHAALQSLIARLHWRGHFIQKLESEPEAERHSFHPLHQGARPDTARDAPALLAWAAGNTGIPFVDACMRSLIATGWLNFRMRAMLQSFASHHLALDWRVSGEHLARWFTDYEPGIHWPQVQMQSGQTGINTPRIYNPVKQGLDQDPEGIFTRRWVPELAALPTALLQTPWLALARHRGGYPAPIVDHLAAAREAKDRLSALRASAGYRAAALDVLTRHGSRGRRVERGLPRARGTGMAGAAPPPQLSLFGADPPPGPTTGEIVPGRHRP